METNFQLCNKAANCQAHRTSAVVKFCWWASWLGLLWPFCWKYLYQIAASVSLQQLCLLEYGGRGPWRIHELIWFTIRKKNAKKITKQTNPNKNILPNKQITLNRLLKQSVSRGSSCSFLQYVFTLCMPCACMLPLQTAAQWLRTRASIRLKLKVCVPRIWMTSARNSLCRHLIPGWSLQHVLW